MWKMRILLQKEFTSERNVNTSGFLDHSKNLCPVLTPLWVYNQKKFSMNQSAEQDHLFS